MKEYKNIMIIIIVLLLFSSISASSAFTAEENKILEEKHDFYTDSFIFEYNDHNSTTYEGDSGLKGAYAKNKMDNLTYYLPVENVRSIAYITKGTFDMSENIDVKHSLFVENRAYDCIMIEMYRKDGTQIPRLDIKANNLTNEQKSYFDNYESQRADYLQQQEEYAIEDLQDSYSRSHSNSHSNSHSRHGFYYGSNGYGIIYTP